MKSILSYGQARLAAKKAKTFATSSSIAINAGNALREGYKLKDYIKVDNGCLSYWRKKHS